MNTGQRWRERTKAMYGTFVSWNGIESEFKYKVERGFHWDSVLRQIDEALRLEEEAGTILNDKLEFVKPCGIQMRDTRMGY